MKSKLCTFRITEKNKEKLKAISKEMSCAENKAINRILDTFDEEQLKFTKGKIDIVPHFTNLMTLVHNSECDLKKEIVNEIEVILCLF